MYSALATRRNSDLAEKKLNAIWSTFNNYSAIEEYSIPEFCPWESTVKPIYEDLCQDILLEHCKGGYIVHKITTRTWTNWFGSFGKECVAYPLTDCV